MDPNDQPYGGNEAPDKEKMDQVGHDSRRPMSSRTNRLSHRDRFEHADSPSSAHRNPHKMVAAAPTTRPRPSQRRQTNRRAQSPPRRKSTSHPPPRPPRALDLTRSRSSGRTHRATPRARPARQVQPNHPPRCAREAYKRLTTALQPAMPRPRASRYRSRLPRRTSNTSTAPWPTSFASPSTPTT